ncbi:MAG: MMPL family transporter [Lentisphaeria bacterium]|nr:MMPL family transporter [Candidatus Neomarinimicrobiota bacterium]MCF7841857.1 MMPL family transporter [Lentisphaeria bacterium]
MTRESFLNKLAHWTVDRTGRLSLILLLITLLFGWMAGQLKLTTSFTNLMPAEDPRVKEYDRIIENFQGASQLLVVAEGDEAQLKAFATDLTPMIAADSLSHLVRNVTDKAPLDFLANHGLMLTKSSELKNLGDLFTDPNLPAMLSHLNDSFEKEYTQSEEKISTREKENSAARMLDGIDRWVQHFSLALAPGADVTREAQAASDALTVGDPYYLSWDRRMLIIQVMPTFTMFDIEQCVEATNTIEKMTHRVAEKHGITAGLTGSIALARDEMVAMSNDSMVVTMIALIGILILFVLTFRMLTSPVLAILTLLVGIIWAMGISWILVGELNLMTSMTAVILAGLGIDFSIHIIAAFSEKRAENATIADAIRFALTRSGTGIITGGVTTAVAFLTMTISELDGMREFGLVLGVGILMTMAAALLILPLLLVVAARTYDRLGRKSTRPPRDVRYQFLGRLANGMGKRYGFTLAALVIVVLFLGYRGAQITWDYNYLNMEPKGLESVKLQDKMIDAFDMSPDVVLFTASSLTEADSLTRIAREMKTAGMVQSISDYLPHDAEQHKRRQLIEKIQSRLNQTQLATRLSLSEQQRVRDELERLMYNIMELQDLAFSGGQDKIFLKSAFLVGVAEIPDSLLTPEEKRLTDQLRRTMGPDIYTGSLNQLLDNFDRPDFDIQPLEAFHNAFGRAFARAAQRLANPEVLDLADLPREIRSQFVSDSGEHFLVTVFPRSNVWNFEYLDRLNAEAAGVSSRATGLPIVFNALMDLIGQDGRRATGAALVVIFLLLLLDFRNLRLALMAITPLVTGVAAMLGIMALSGLQITLLNVMAIPLIIGIGIDDGVHVIHRYLIEGPGKLKVIFASTGRAVFVTSLTTMLGFGSLWFATYRGLGSMGIALFIGVGACFLMTVVSLSALLGWYGSRKK